MRKPAVYLFVFLLLIIPVFLLIPSGGTLPAQAQEGGEPVVVRDPVPVTGPVVQEPVVIQEPEQVQVPQNRVYVFRDGDTLCDIATLYGITVEELLAMNPGLGETDLVQPGHQIIVPAIGGGLDGGQPYLMISPLSGTTGTLLTVNGYNFPANMVLQIGPGSYGSDVLYLDTITSDANGSFVTYVTVPAEIAQPGETWIVLALIPALNISVQSPLVTIGPPGVAVDTHVVVRGDTLSEIAKMYGSSVDRLMAINPQIQNPNLIYPGEIFNIR